MCRILFLKLRCKFLVPVPRQSGFHELHDLERVCELWVVKDFLAHALGDEALYLRDRVLVAHAVPNSEACFIPFVEHRFEVLVLGGRREVLQNGSAGIIDQLVAALIFLVQRAPHLESVPLNIASENGTVAIEIVTEELDSERVDLI